jgi:hypothetical protein
MSGDLICNGTHHPRTVLIHDQDVHFPLRGRGNMNCKSGSCATTISVELANCHGNAANCCFGPSCAVCDTEMDFIPDGGAFEATFTQNGANKTGAQQATINDACTSHDGTYACTTVSCTSNPPGLCQPH